MTTRWDYLYSGNTYLLEKHYKAITKKTETLKYLQQNHTKALDQDPILHFV